MVTSREIATGLAEMPALLFVVCQSLSSELRVTTCMPIKFRCEKCRQFLGLSRSLAGQIVDCPTCGRSTRVPNLDGTRQPIPKQPKLPQGDSPLLNALDQLAELGKPTESTSDTPQQQVANPSDPVAIEPVSAAKPIDLPEPSKEQVIAQPDLPPEAPATPDVLAELAAAEPMDVPIVNRRTFPLGLLAAAVVSGAIFFAAGWLLRGSDSPRNTTVAPEEIVESNSSASAPPAPDSGVNGRITYRRQESACLPDRGSRIIVWKVGYTPRDLWSANGFRPGDSGQLTDLAGVLIKEAGGAMATVDDDGHFQLDLQSGGEY